MQCWLLGGDIKMIKDIEVREWDYSVYFKRESDGQHRLVYVFASESEAAKCAGKIFADYGVSTFYTPKLKLEVYE
jgi:hypothetical protein